MRLSRFLYAAACALLLGAAHGPARADWQWQRPAVVVTAKSTHHSNVFYVGQPVTLTLAGSGAASYQVRDYDGNVVDQGAAGGDGSSLRVGVSAPGWYKLYLLAPGGPGAPTVGTATFCVFRSDPHFAAVPPAGTPYGASNEFGMDNPMRGVVGMGPARHYINPASSAATVLPAKATDIGLDQQYYLAVPDPVRPRDLLMNFPAGAPTAADLSGITQTVTQLQGSVHYWEGRNEPNTETSGTAYAAEMKTFSQTVHAVNPGLKVIGPAIVSVGPLNLSWIEDFLKAGGGDAVDAFSFHAYNVVNGDLSLARRDMDGLNTLLAKYGQDKKEKWQTEQGYPSALYGTYAPRHQGRWTMLMAMVFEQYGIPREHNSYFDDKSHGFWDIPTWWENDDETLNPAAPLMRVWAEELYGAKYARAYDFGDPGNKMYVGSLFQGPTKSVAAFMSAGGTDGAVTLQVSSGTSLHVVSAFGVASDLPVTNGQVSLPVPEVPVYVEMAAGQTIQVVPLNWGPNLARQVGVTASASDYTPQPGGGNDIAKLFNGQMESWYYDFAASSTPWTSTAPAIGPTASGQADAWVQLNFPVPTQVSRVVIYCPVPWQSQGSLLDYELQYDKDGQWVTIDHTTEPAKTFQSYTDTVHCAVDSFYSDRCIFTHQFPAVTTGKLRVLVHDCTWGGGATHDVVVAGGQWGPHQITIREIEAYSPLFTGQARTLQGRVTDRQGRGIVGAPVTLTGWQAKSTVTGTGGAYSFSGLTEGANYTVTPVKNDSTMLPRSLTFSHLVGNPTANFVTVPQTPATGTGLRGDYYLTGYDWPHAISPNFYALTRTDSTINTGDNWTTMLRPAGIGPDRFAVSWTGQVEPRYSETYTFTVVGDDGVRLWVNGQPLMDTWGQYSRTTTATVKLTAGQRADIRLDYYQQNGFAVCNLFWASPSQPSQIVPQSQLYPAVVTVPPTVGLGVSATQPGGATPPPLALTASVSAPDGTIGQVYYLVNGSAVGSASAAPYAFQWQAPQNGVYRIVAVATDNLGAATVSDPVTVTLGPQILIKGSLQVRQPHRPKKGLKKGVKKAVKKGLPRKSQPRKAVKKAPPRKAASEGFTATTS